MFTILCQKGLPVYQGSNQLTVRIQFKIIFWSVLIFIFDDTFSYYKTCILYVNNRRIIAKVKDSEVFFKRQVVVSSRL